MVYYANDICIKYMCIIYITYNNITYMNNVCIHKTYMLDIKLSTPQKNLHIGI